LLEFNWICAAAFGVGYFALAMVLVVGLNRKFDLVGEDDLPSVSVIVAARNEEENIAACLAALDQLDYPRELLEIVVVNDRSQDRTHEIISRFVRKNPDFTYLNLKNKSTKLSGKAAALAQGIEMSRGQLIFITDADCIVRPRWLHRMQRHFSPEVGIVVGFTVLGSEKNIFAKLQALDWIYLLSAAAGAIGLGYPLSWIGNNFAIRRETYDDVGGYQGVGYSLTEDFALLRAVARRTNWRVAFSAARDGLVTSQPVRTFADFISQRKRWAIGGANVHWLGKILIVFSFFVHLIAIGSALSGVSFFSAILFASIFIGDFLILYKLLKKFELWRLLPLLPIYKLFSFFYMLILALILVFHRRVVWKGIQYQR